jgi:hypothetical protein
MECERISEIRKSLELEVKKHKLFGNKKAESVYRTKLNSIIINTQTIEKKPFNY